MELSDQSNFFFSTPAQSTSAFWSELSELEQTEVGSTAAIYREVVCGKGSSCNEGVGDAQVGSSAVCIGEQSRVDSRVIEAF